MRWLANGLLSVLALIGLADYPVIATLLASTVLCGYCVRMLSTPEARFVFVYPAVCFWLSQHFTTYTFFEIGDGPAYFAVMDDILPRLTNNNYQSLLALMAFVGPKYLNLGFIPTALLPNLLFEKPDAIMYQLTQAYVHIALVSLLLALTVRWEVISDRYRSSVFLFMLVSPGYLALVAYPTRHHITSFGGFLLFISVEACFRKCSIGRLLTLLIALILVFFCKAALVPLFLLYVLFRLYQPQRIFLNVAFGSLLLVAGVYAFQYVQPLYDTRFTSETIGVFKDAALGPFMPLYKYVMAIVSPFPYYKYGVVVDTIAYGGNWWLLLLFVPAGAIGLWLFYRMLLNPINLWGYDDDTKRLFGYGAILSLSILGGSTGFLMYILICQPFFAPLFLIREYPVPVSVVLFTLFLLNLIVMLLNKENVFDYL